MDPMQAMLSGGAPMGFGGQAPPTMANPGGLPAPTDPAEFGFSVCVQGLKQLAQVLQRDDEKLANEVDAMANKLNRRFIDRKQRMEQAMETMQGRIVAAQM